jgi:uncharacterized protein
MHPFHDLGEVLGALRRLMERDPPLVKAPARQPGTKEVRYAHLLSGDVESWEPPQDSQAPPSQGSHGDRIARLESEVASLRAEVADLKQQLVDSGNQGRGGRDPLNWFDM